MLKDRVKLVVDYVNEEGDLALHVLDVLDALATHGLTIVEDDQNEAATEYAAVQIEALDWDSD